MPAKSKTKAAKPAPAKPKTEEATPPPPDEATPPPAPDEEGPSIRSKNKVGKAKRPFRIGGVYVERGGEVSLSSEQAARYGHWIE